MRDRGVVTDPALNPNVSAAEGQSDGLKSPQPLEVPKPVDAETRRAMLRHMLMARGIDDEAGLIAEPGRARPLAVVPGPGGGASRLGDGDRRRSGDLSQLSRARGRRSAWHRRRLVGRAVGRPHVLRLESAACTGSFRTPWCWRHRPCTAWDTPSASGCKNMAETVVVYVGDGATSEGDMSEAMNLAAVESAQVLVHLPEQRMGDLQTEPRTDVDLDRGSRQRIRYSIVVHLRLTIPTAPTSVPGSEAVRREHPGRPASSSCGPRASEDTPRRIPMPATVSPKNSPRRWRTIR